MLLQFLKTVKGNSLVVVVFTVSVAGFGCSVADIVVTDGMGQDMFGSASQAVENTSTVLAGKGFLFPMLLHVATEVGWSAELAATLITVVEHVATVTRFGIVVIVVVGATGARSATRGVHGCREQVVEGARCTTPAHAPFAATVTLPSGIGNIEDGGRVMFEGFFGPTCR